MIDTFIYLTIGCVVILIVALLGYDFEDINEFIFAILLWPAFTIVIILQQLYKRVGRG